MPRAITIVLMSIALTLTTCVASDADFDFEDQGFYYGCSTADDCAGDGPPYVCCFDKLTAEDGQCVGRCLPASECSEGRSEPQWCEMLGITQ